MAKRKSRKSKQFDMNRGLLAVLMSIVTSLFMILALVLESGLLFAVSALSTLATIAAVKAAKQKAKNDRARKTALPKPPRVPPSVKPKSTPTPPQPTGSTITCTETGKPTEQCPCASRHVVSAEGAKRYGGPVGRPIGRKAKEPKVPTTSRAKPIQPGYAVQKQKQEL